MSFVWNSSLYVIYIDNSTQFLPIPSQVLEGKGKYVEDRTSKTGI